MLVCKYCYDGICSHEGNLPYMKVFEFPSELITEDENGNEYVNCEWCEEDTPTEDIIEI